MNERAELADILKKKSYFRGDFVLASGRRSDYYFDCKLTTYSDPRGLRLTASLMLGKMRDLKHRVDGIGGLTLGAASLAVAMGQLALDEDWILPAFVVRKEPKTHGRQRLIEGTVAEGANIVIVDDVITSGDSVLRAIDAVENARAHVARVIVLVDREEGGREVLQKYDYQSIFTIADLRE